MIADHAGHVNELQYESQVIFDSTRESFVCIYGRTIVDLRIPGTEDFVQLGGLPDTRFSDSLKASGYTDDHSNQKIGS